MATLSHLLSSKASTSTAYAHHSEALSKLMQLLESAEWISQTEDYLEQESIMFDPSVSECQLYKQIHENYKTLVDKLFADFCKTSRITTEVLQETLNEAKRLGQTNKIVQKLMFPVVLFDDYDTFKQTMINQNIELQTFAMESIQKKTGSYPLSFTADDNQQTETRKFQDTDDVLLEMVLRKSKEEYDELQRRIQDEEDAIERALRESERIAELLASQSKVSVHDLKALVQQMEALSTLPEEEERALDDTLSFLKQRPTVTITTALNQENPQQFVSVKQFISPEELKRRQAYLRAQRDKLLSKKAALKAAENSSALHEEVGVGETPDAAMESRKKLAEKLKTEIVDKH